MIFDTSTSGHVFFQNERSDDLGMEMDLDEDDEIYTMRVVDLPCILESQKILSHMLYKIADISQLIIVDPPAHASSSTSQHAQTSNSHLHPHGISAPLRFARSRRFRHIKQTTQNTQERVARLLYNDSLASVVNLSLVDRDYYENMKTKDGLEDGSADEAFLMGLEETLGEDDGEGQDEGEDRRDDNEIREEIKVAMEDIESDHADSTENEEDPESDDDEEEDREVTNNAAQVSAADRALEESNAHLRDEIHELQAKIQEKLVLVDKTMNPILRKRFEDVVKSLRKELKLKMDRIK